MENNCPQANLVDFRKWEMYDWWLHTLVPINDRIIRVYLFPGFLVGILGFCLLFSTGCGSPPPPSDPENPSGILEPPLFPATGSQTSSIFYRLKIQEAERNYQKSYLNLIEKLNNTDISKMRDRDKLALFYEYNNASQKYRDIVKKVKEYEKESREKCNSIMRSLISGVQVYDKLTNKKLFKFDAAKLVELKILKETPVCPGGGEYAIFYKDGRRLFRCSTHGTLKQR
jgi:hypothetical protein